MSCADVCLDHCYDNDNEFYSASMVRARKPHKCCECQETIPVGATYERVAGKSDGRMWNAITCALCVEIRKAFVCGSWLHGYLWESIEDELFPVWDTSGPIDCLAKLETLEARQKARQRYADWKE